MAILSGWTFWESVFCHMETAFYLYQHSIERALFTNNINCYKSLFISRATMIRICIQKKVIILMTWNYKSNSVPMSEPLSAIVLFWTNNCLPSIGKTTFISKVLHFPHTDAQHLLIVRLFVYDANNYSHGCILRAVYYLISHALSNALL